MNTFNVFMTWTSKNAWHTHEQRSDRAYPHAELEGDEDVDDGDEEEESGGEAGQAGHLVPDLAGGVAGRQEGDDAHFKVREAAAEGRVPLAIHGSCYRVHSLKQKSQVVRAGHSRQGHSIPSSFK